MRRLVLTLALSLGASPALATEVAADATAADGPSAFGIGSRASGWFGGYLAPGLGGHLKVQPLPWIGVEAFSDNFLTVQDDAWRQDHVLGFSLYSPVLVRGASWYLSPTVGACVDIRFAHPRTNGVPSTSDVLFGLHGGAMFEYYVAHGFAFEANAAVYGYLGHETSVERWTANVSNELGVTAQGLLTAGLNYYF